MRNGVWRVCAAMMCAVAAPVQGAVIVGPNLIVNPGFEQPVITDPVGFQFFYSGNPIITGWTITGSSVDVLKNTRWQPHEGLQSLDLTGVTAGGIYQDVNTVAGKTYHLSFWVAGNPEFAGSGGGPFVKMAQLGWAGSPVTTLSFDVTGKTNFNLGWTQYEFDLTATGPTSRLQFSSLTSGFSGLMLDDLSLFELAPAPPAPVPLPPAVFLGLIGAAATAAGHYRRRYRRAAAI